MTVIPYQRIHPEELADLERRYGSELTEQEALYLLRQEREWAMREQQFYGGTREVMCSEPDRSGESNAIYPAVRVVTGAHRAVNECEKVTAEQIVSMPEPRWPAWVMLGIFVVVAIGEVWLAAHYFDVIKSWFR